MAKVAFVLAGCGAKDGSEITEAVALTIALQQAKHEVSFFAPDRKAFHLVDHLSGLDSREGRNMLVESARIARGNIKPLSHASAKDFDALVFAGGFGAAKNLCNFAQAGADAQLEEDVKNVLIPFMKSQKPVGALCISPVILALGARECGYQGAKITLGDGSAAEAVAAIEKWGCAHVPCHVWQACLDEKYKLVSAPAYMHDEASHADIFESAHSLVNALNTIL